MNNRFLSVRGDLLCVVYGLLLLRFRQRDAYAVLAHAVVVTLSFYFYFLPSYTCTQFPFVFACRPLLLCVVGFQAEAAAREKEAAKKLKDCRTARCQALRKVGG